ncbi:MAG: shikimate kinase [Candidatus Aminicenantes bacterium]
MDKTRFVAVVGKPVLHSRSPQLYQSLLKKKYFSACLRLSAGSASEILPAAASLPLKGFNVTSPFKHSLLPYLDILHPDAEKITAVNLVMRHRDRWMGFNTDHTGVRHAFQKHGVNISGKKVLIAGAGGAARAAAFACLKAKAASVKFLNRSEKNARSSARIMRCEYAPLSEWSSLAEKSDILISCIPGAQAKKYLNGNIFPEIVMEADYAGPGLDFLRQRSSHLYIPGEEWLIYQGLPSFRRLTGKPPTDVNPEALLQKKSGETRSASPRIALIGFMGTGKTTTGEILARMLNLPFIDTDRRIQDETRLSLPRIFQQQGERGFRDLENRLIPDMIRGTEKSVAALGGGAPVHPNIKNILREKCLVVWLWTSWLTTWKRISGSPRPSLAAQQRGDSLESIFMKRKIHYAQAADVVIPADSLSPETAARRIADEICSTF